MSYTSIDTSSAEGVIFTSFSDPNVAYRMGPFLGKGGFGVVHKAQRSTDKQLFAMKVIEKTDLSAFMQEATFLHLLKHPHILFLEDVAGALPNPCLIIEIADGTLHDCRQSLPSDTHEGIAQAVAFQMLSALQFLHSQTMPVVHKDVKPENILVFQRGVNIDSMVFKLSDFGLAETLMDRDPMEWGGTMPYMAPEMKQHGVDLGVNVSISIQFGRIGIELGYEDRVDIFSLGKVLQYVLVNSPERNEEEISLRAQEIHRLMTTCNAKDRPRASDCLGHYWVRQGADLSALLSQTSLYPFKTTVNNPRFPPIQALAHRAQLEYITESSSEFSAGSCNAFGARSSSSFRAQPSSSFSAQPSSFFNAQPSGLSRTAPSSSFSAEPSSSSHIPYDPYNNRQYTSSTRFPSKFPDSGYDSTQAGRERR